MDAEPALVRFPFPLPERFAAALGYRGRHGLVGLYWGAGDELAAYDPDAEALGLHEHGPYLGVVQRLPVLLWFEEQLIELGSAIRPATHHPVLDVARNAAYVAPAVRLSIIVTAPGSATSCPPRTAPSRAAVRHRRRRALARAAPTRARCG